MSAPKHTAWPWRDEPTNGAKLTYVAVSTVAGANGSTVVFGQCAGPDKEANARLIAAAPDLLEACKLLDAYLYATAPDSNERQIVAAAIEKAVGA